MSIRGIRGATSVTENTAEAILSATRELLTAILKANPQLNPSEICNIFFTLTPDLNAAYPALAARDLGWGQVPLLCSVEIDVPNSLKSCVRLLIQWNTDLQQSQINHIYLREAVSLRPDLVKET